ncbi:unnamed protein product [Thelazia callipaeda]|uniref:Metallophos domain-containing protein n=1 Tax=Thelazia callipaeda TaxID=103827 RepID=A0A0N5CVQ4_THECL|nr:unnamed protein product [Thelazia callipaeda]
MWPKSAAIFKSRKFSTILSLLLALFLTGAGFAATRSTPVVFYFQVNRVNVKIRNLPSSFDGFSIALLTDIHVGPTVDQKRVLKIVTKTSALYPDVVAISGDLVDGFPSNLAERTKPLANLKSKYGVYFVTGNHEYYHGDVDQWLHYFTTKLNITVLRNTHRNLCSISGDCICIAGVDDYYTERLRIHNHRMDAERALDGCSNAQPVILLVHQPNGASKIVRNTKKRIDLILSGHTHGGQLYILWLFAYLMNAFMYGHYRIKDSGTQIYVSSGVNYWGPPVGTVSYHHKDCGCFRIESNMSGWCSMRSVYFAFAISITCIIFLNLFGFQIFGVYSVDDYRRGNRARQLSTIRYEFYLLPFSVFTYFRVTQFAKFTLTSGSNRSNKDQASEYHFFKSIFSFQVVSCFHRFINKCFSIFPSLGKLCLDKHVQVACALTIAFFLSFISYLLCDTVVVKHLPIKVNGLPANANGIQFALISDIHAGAAVCREQVEKIVDRVNSQEVAGVFIVGDVVDAPRESIVDRVKPLRFLESKTFYVSGNHEYYYGNASEWFELFEQYGFEVLNNRHVNFHGICVAGVSDFSSGWSGLPNHKFDPVKALRNCPQTSPTIVLSHNPASAKEIAFNKAHLRVDLILSGHTHAGQFYTVAPIVYLMLPYYYGLYRISSETQLFVTAGTLYQGAPMKMVFMSEIWIIKLYSVS